MKEGTGADPFGETLTGDATAETLQADTTGAAPRARLTAEHAGRYETRGELGRGGMGRVLEAHDAHLGRVVAVKELLGQITSGDAGVSIGLVQRFLREARITGQLEHPSIVPVYELGQRADGTLYYTMRRIRGRSLAAVLAECKTLPERLKLLSHFRDVCDAVAYAHARGVVHRDLKPDNVMIGEFGETLVVDWGLAKTRADPEPAAPASAEAASTPPRPIDSGDASQTLDGHAIGTPAYMSPEQARGQLSVVDERSDVWGLGAMLFELLTGRPPFVGKSVMDVLRRVMEEAPPPVKTVCPDAPAELCAVCDRALQPDRSSRTAEAAHVAADIAAYQDGGQVRAYEYSSLELVRRFVQRNRAASLTALVVLVALTGTAVFTANGYGEERRARHAAETRRGEAETEREGAERTARQARAQLRRAQIERAEEAFSSGDPAGASLLAANALAASEHDEAEEEPWSARARGVLLEAPARITWGAWRVAGELEPGARVCDDGRTAVSAARGGGLRVTELATGRTTTRAGAEHDAVIACCLGRAVTRGAHAALVDVQTGAEVAPLPHDATTAACAEGRLALVTPQGQVRIFDAEGRQTDSLAVELRDARPLWARGVLVLASTTAARLSIVPFPRGAAIRSIPLPAPAVDLGIDPSGEQAAIVFGDARIAVLDLATGALDVRFVDGAVRDARFVESATLAVAERSGAVTLRGLPSLARLETLRLPADVDVRLESVAGGLLALPASAEGSGGWSWPRATQTDRDRQPVGGHVTALVVDAARDRLLVAGDAGLLTLSFRARRLGLARPLVALPSELGAPVRVAVAQDGAVAFADAAGAVALVEHDADSARVVLAAASGDAAPGGFGLAFSRDGRSLFAGSRGGALRRFDRASHTESAAIDVLGAAVDALVVSPDGATLAVLGAHSDTRLVDIGRLAVARTLDTEATAAAYAEDGTLALGGRELSLVDRAGALRTLRVALRAPVHALAFAQGGARLWVALTNGDALVVQVQQGVVEAEQRAPGTARALAIEGEDAFFGDAESVSRLALDRAVRTDDPVALAERLERQLALRVEGVTVRAALPAQR